MMVATRQMTRVDSDRWLYRTAAGDFGPVTTDGLLTAISGKKVSPETLICVLGTQKWAPMKEFAIFRDHYDKCLEQWEREADKRAVAEIGRKLELKQKRTVGAWLLIAVGSVAGLAVLAWGVWRLSLASPIGFESLVSMQRPPELPKAQRKASIEVALPVPTDFKLARLGEPESYDTAGVAIGLDTEGGTQKMHFDESGEVAAIAQEDLDRIVGSARQGLNGCARDAALRNADFGGTDVGFTVVPGALSKIGVGAEARGNPAFMACVKAVLAKVTVPNFSGSERRVTIPLKIAR